MFSWGSGALFGVFENADQKKTIDDISFFSVIVNQRESFNGFPVMLRVIVTRISRDADLKNVVVKSREMLAFVYHSSCQNLHFWDVGGHISH